MKDPILPIQDPSSIRPPPSSLSSLYPSADSENHVVDDSSVTRLLIPPQFNEHEKSEIERPILITRSSSYNSSNSSEIFHQQRRHSASESSVSLASDGMGRQSFSAAGTSHASSDMFLLSRLCYHLLCCIGLCYRLIARILALCCYAIFLLPGFIQVGYHYYFSRHVRRDIVYGDQPRNRLDLFLPENCDTPRPVVAFVTGGAWIIGYKAWGSLLGQQLAERGIIVACIDYRNYPQGTIGDMVDDSSRGIAYVCNHIGEYGGDPNRIYLMGQSAGAHIAACTLIEQAMKQTGEGDDSTSWSLSQIKAYFGLSGGYNMFNLVDHFHSRGLYRSLFFKIMEGEESLQKFSPEIVVQNPAITVAVSRLPRFVLFHGTGDYSIPFEASVSFANTLERVGVKAEAILYDGKTHTDVFLQDPMRGGEDELFHDVVANIHAGDEEALKRDASARPRKRLVPEFMLKLAHIVSPF